MAIYLLDANHASPLVTLTHPMRDKFFTALQAGHSFAICVPVLSEVWYGISLLPRAKQNREEWARLRVWLPCYSLDDADGDLAAELQITLRRIGRQLETVDALIAAVGIRYDLTLLTTDGDFLPITQLKKENWLEPMN